jgi:hypothetical protein
MLNLNAHCFLFCKNYISKIISLRFIFLSFSLILTLPAYGQVCVPQAADDCVDAPVLCGLTELNGYSCRNPPPPNLSGPTPLCPGGGVPNNMSWWAFVAGSNTTTIQINVTNCTSVGGQMGVQAGIWTDCSYTTPVFCQPACWVGNQTLSGSTIPCQTYYVFVDGCAGSECDYVVQVLAGANPPGLAGPPTLDGPETGCVGDFLCFTASVPGQCRPDYEWTIDGTPVDNIEPQICESFQGEGTYEVCVTARVGNDNTICDEAGPICQTVVIQKLPEEERPGENLCYEDRFGLFFQECATPVPPTPGLHRICCDAVKPNGCVFKVCKEYSIKPQPEEGKEIILLCEEETIVLPSGQVVTECGEYVDYHVGGGPLGCDTTIKFFVYILKPDVHFSLPKCEGDQFCIDAITSFQCADTTYDYTEFWISTETGDTISRDTTLLCVESPGEYCYFVQLDHEELTCPTAQYCVEIPETFSAEITVPEVKCVSDTIRAEAVANVGGIDSSNWSVAGGTIIYLEGDSVMFWLADPGRTEVEICYEGFPKDCSKISNCSIVPLPPTIDYFEWEQVGNELCFYSPGSESGQTEWIIDGTEYTGDSICVGFEMNRDILAVVQFENECGEMVTIEQRVRFDLRKSIAKLHDKGNMGITPQPFQSSIVLERSIVTHERISLEVVDVSGRVLHQRQEEWPKGMTSMRLPNITLAPGIYYIVVTEHTTGRRTVGSVFWSN